MSAGDLDVLFSRTSRARRTHVLICVASCADDGRIAAASGKFEGKATGSSDAGHFTFFIQRRAVNRSRWREEHAPDRGHAELRFNADGSGAFLHPFDFLLPQFGARWSVRRFELWRSQTRPPPVIRRMKFFPQLPGSARAFGQQVLARKTHSDGK